MRRSNMFQPYCTTSTRRSRMQSSICARRKFETPTYRALPCCTTSSRARIVPAGRHLLVADAEFGDDRDLMTTAAECSRQGLFRYAHAVGLGGIEAGDAA